MARDFRFWSIRKVPNGFVADFFAGPIAGMPHAEIRNLRHRWDSIQASPVQTSSGEALSRRSFWQCVSGGRRGCFYHARRRLGSRDRDLLSTASTLYYSLHCVAALVLDKGASPFAVIPGTPNATPTSP
jgi:hypothetical protein